MLNKYINFFLLSKKILTKPEEKKVLIFDEDDSEIISKYFNKNDIETLPIRMAYKPGQKVNLYILFKIILNFKFTMKSYFEEYINVVKPKIVISLSDNWPIFYRLKKDSQKTKKIVIQRAFRTCLPTDMLSNLNSLKKEKTNLNCDFLLMFNKEIGKIYNTFVSGKIIPIGSFRSNSVSKKPQLKKKKIDMLFISTFRPHLKVKKEDFIFFENLKKYCKKKKLKIHILGSTNTDIEKNFYKDILKDSVKEFLYKTEKRSTYKIVDLAKIILSIDSTLGYEAAARGKNVCFFCIRSKIFPLSTYRFGWPVKKNYKGNFWTDSNTFEELSRIINFYQNKNSKKIMKIKIKNIISFDEKNKKFKSLIEKLNT